MGGSLGEGCRLEQTHTGRLQDLSGAHSRLHKIMVSGLWELCGDIACLCGVDGRPGVKRGDSQRIQAHTGKTHSFWSAMLASLTKKILGERSTMMTAPSIVSLVMLVLRPEASKYV